jgi:hypothetical protein
MSDLVFVFTLEFSRFTKVHVTELMSSGFIPGGGWTNTNLLVTEVVGNFLPLLFDPSLISFQLSPPLSFNCYPYR